MTCRLCPRALHARGLCTMHYKRWRRGHAVPGMPPLPRCTAPGCARSVYAAARCWHHWSAPPEPLRRWDVDRSQVDAASAGRLPAAERVTPGTRQEIVRTLHARGMHDGAVAEHARCSPRTVLRIRRRLGLPAVPRWAR